MECLNWVDSGRAKESSSKEMAYALTRLDSYKLYCMLSVTSRLSITRALYIKHSSSQRLFRSCAAIRMATPVASSSHPAPGPAKQEKVVKEKKDKNAGLSAFPLEVHLSVIFIEMTYHIHQNNSYNRGQNSSTTVSKYSTS